MFPNTQAELFTLAIKGPAYAITLLVDEVPTVSRLPIDRCDEVRLCRGSTRALTINYGSNIDEMLSVVCSQ